MLAEAFLDLSCLRKAVGGGVRVLGIGN